MGFAVPDNAPLCADNLDLLARECGFSLPAVASGQMTAYLALLMQWNKVMNLVGTRQWQDTFRTLIIDSLYLADVFRNLNLQENSTLPPETWDMGAGAGLPGIPLRMLWQEGSYWMVEAREKRALFLSTVLARTPLPGTRVYSGRVEAFMNASQSGPKAVPRLADCVVSRAFMPWEQVLDLVRPHLRLHGQVVLLLREHINPPPDWRVSQHVTYQVKTITRHIVALQQSTK